jgi:hypothetical protein
MNLGNELSPLHCTPLSVKRAVDYVSTIQPPPWCPTPIFVAAGSDRNYCLISYPETEET